MPLYYPPVLPKDTGCHPKGVRGWQSENNGLRLKPYFLWLCSKANECQCSVRR